MHQVVSSEVPDLSDFLTKVDPSIASQFGYDGSLTDYLDQSLSQDPTIEASTDFVQSLSDSVAAEYGNEIAGEVETDQARNSIILTANHHGIDTFADSFQATMLLAHWMKRKLEMQTIVVCACSSVSVSNPSCPATIRIYDKTEDADFLQTLRIFPSRYQNVSLTKASGFDEGHIAKVRRELQRLPLRAKNSCNTKAYASSFIERVLDDKELLRREMFLDQARLANNIIWEGIFTYPGAPKLVFLELEKVATRFIVRDLNRPDSLLARVFFDRRVRDAVLKFLEGVPGCWRISAGGGHTAGTSFFWAYSKTGRRVPLRLASDAEGLCLVDDCSPEDGAFVRWTASDLIGALCANTILPSLFTVFTVLAFSRGVTCVGGFVQSAYLPKMRDGVGRAIEHVDGTIQFPYLTTVQTDASVSAVQPIGQLASNGFSVPAGPLEFLARGGLTSQDMDHAMSTPVRTATTQALVELAPHLFSDGSVGRVQHLLQKQHLWRSEVHSA